jgi:Mce-associated membrane protein
VQAGVVSATGDRAVVLLAVDQTITNTNSPQPRVERNRMQLTLLKQDGKWRLDDVQLV